jgi:hypothetical protein
MEIIMRYLNTTTLRQETKSNSNNIIDSDARVSNWFTPCPDGYFGEWVGDTYTFTLIPLPTQAELDAQALAQTEYDSLQYQRDRQPEYPPMSDYLDGIVKGDQVQIDKYISDCQAVKDKYPKGE